MLIISIFFISLAVFSTGEADPHIQAMYETMPRDQFIEYFNSLGLSYTITQHNMMKPVVSGLIIDPERRKNLTVIEHTITDDLPENFDARDKWPHCVTIREQYNQGVCGSCWAFGTATSASDRTCILKNVTVRLAEQDFECISSNVCNGGDPTDALDYWIQYGLVSQECKPYNISALKEGKCGRTCKNGKDYKEDKHKGTSQKLLKADDGTIRTELFKNGSIVACFDVFEDFFHYHGGVYTHDFGECVGGHTVRVLGYGIEKGVKYWLAVNSWGDGWGDHGYFKVKRFTDDLRFEHEMIASFP